MADRPLEVPFENLGPGPSPASLADLADAHDFVVVYLQRDHYCTNCRDQVRAVADRIDDFRDRAAQPVSVLPEPVERVREWQDAYDLPYPLFADPDATAGEGFDQPVRFGILGDWSDFFGRMPQVVIVDGRQTPPEVVWTHAGRSTFDRPSVDDVLGLLDDRREGAV
jgi:peroxiredoxin Q/BCP